MKFKWGSIANCPRTILHQFLSPVFFCRFHSTRHCRCISVSLPTMNNTNTQTWFVFIPKEKKPTPLHEWSRVQMLYIYIYIYIYKSNPQSDFLFPLKWTDQMRQGCYLAACLYFISIMNITFDVKYNLIIHRCCSDNGKDMNECCSKCFVCNLA